MVNLFKFTLFLNVTVAVQVGVGSLGHVNIWKPLLVKVIRT